MSSTIRQTTNGAAPSVVAMRVSTIAATPRTPSTAASTRSRISQAKIAPPRRPTTRSANPTAPGLCWSPSTTSGAPAAGDAAIRPGEQRQRRADEDLEVEPGRAMVDVPDVELDPLLPWQRRPTVHLRPARQARPHLEAAPLALRVRVHLVAESRAGADQAHLAAEHIPELRQLVERRPPEQAADPRDAAVPLVDGVA